MTQDDRFTGIDQAVALPALLGYVNFSEGRPDPRFQKQLHDAFAFLVDHGSAKPWEDLQHLLLARLKELHQAGGAAFADISQAEGVIQRAFGEVLPAYRAHHRDLLAHQSDADLWQPFFLARVCEAVLSQRGPWSEAPRIVEGSLKQLNDYVGHRPVAVLENKRRGEIYDHERLRPIPLYLRGAGVARGKYHDLVELAMGILESTSESIRIDAFFDLNLLDELAFDPRAYDFGHPADKRPNYCFGEWDPHHLDAQARFRRFVPRQILIDGLWLRVQKASSNEGIAKQESPPPEELLFESAAVLAGTILMASGVCGSGPQTHDSSVTLATLVPKIARYRENFYARLLPTVPGKHGARLKQEAKLLKQPFGGVRQALNHYLANQRALQLQQRYLALLFAEIGYADAARRQVARIPVASVRILTEMQILLTTGDIGVEQGRLDETSKHLGAIEDLLMRGIACGALVDPWNILGFGGQYPRFHALEDSVRDARIDDLIHIVEQLFDLYGRFLSAGASSDNFKPDKDLAREMRRLADWWDRFATTTVSDIEHVHGNEATQSAEHVARSLTRWRQQGAAAADLAFWRAQLDGFRSAKAFALVVDALLQREDFRASAALLMTWLSQANEVPLVEGDHSFHQLALSWMLRLGLVAASEESNTPLLELVVKFFDYLEANADEYWHVPRLDVLGTGEDADVPGADEEDGQEEADEVDSIYSAAYEEMTYRDSTDDDVEGEVLDILPQKDFNLLHEAQRLETRLHFLSTLARLWNIAARTLSSGRPDPPPTAMARIASWLQRAEHNERELRELLNNIHAHAVPKPSGAFEAMIEYDQRRSTKERLLNLVIGTCADHALAVGALRGLNPGADNADGPSWQPIVLQLERAFLHEQTDEARRLLQEFMARFRQEPLLYTPLSQEGHPQLILQANLAQMMLRGLVHNLPKQGMIQETYQLLRLARSMEAGQELSGPRITEFDRLFQLGLQAVMETLIDAALSENVEPARFVEALESVVEPFAVTWRDHSQTLRVATLELITHDRDWLKMTDFIQRYGRELFHARFLALANLRGILLRGVGAYLKDLQVEPDPLHPMQLLDDLDNEIPRQEAERFLQIILQTLIENYDHLRDYNATTTQSDYGDNLYRLFDYLRLKARYDRAAWLLRPLNLVHESLARRDGATAALWRQRVGAITRDSADKFVQDLAKLEKAHGIRLATIRDRIEERFVQPLVLDRLCALIEPALEQAISSPGNTTPGSEGVTALEKELELFATNPSGVGLDVPPWLVRLQNELERIRTSQSDLGYLAETMFHVPEVAVPFESLVAQLHDWEKKTQD
jgi:hypothetical protein